MVYIVNQENVRRDTNPRRTVWFLINKDTVPLPLGAEAGRVSYFPLSSPEDRPGAHKDPDSEFFYVIDGEGVLLHDGEETRVRAGDAFVVPAGVSHAIWSTSEKPLEAFYVEMVPR